MAPLNQRDRERSEIAFWTESPTESPGAESLDALTNKMSEARVVLEKFPRFESLLRDARFVLELGGGQGWVSCLVEKQFAPEVVMGSDIAPDAIASVPEWERILRVRLNWRLRVPELRGPRSGLQH